MPTAYQLRQKAEEDELLNITGYVRRAQAKGKARREALERGEILNEPEIQIHPFRTTMANRLRQQGLTSAALPPTHPVYKPKATMANMLDSSTSRKCHLNRYFNSDTNSKPFLSVV